MVGRRRHLPDLPALVRRRRRRRHRRPAGHHGAARRPRRRWASTPCGCPRSTARRRPTRATTSPTTATSTRCSAPSPTSTRCSRRPRARAEGRSSTSCRTTPPTSTAWFQAALAAAPGSPERARYLFRDGRGADGAQPPNDWQSRVRRPGLDPRHRARRAPGQWYLHLFDPRQPDLDWDTRRSAPSSTTILRFWLDRGVDGFRIDVAHGLVKADGPARRAAVRRDGRRPASRPTRRRTRIWDQDGVHEIYRRLARVLDEYSGRPRIARRRGLGADRPSGSRATSAPDEMHQAFNFAYLRPAGTRPACARSIDASLARAAARSARRDLGAVRTTTSCGTRAGTGCPRTIPSNAACAPAVRIHVCGCRDGRCHRSFSHQPDAGH